MQFKDGVITEVSQYKEGKLQTVRLVGQITEAMKKVDETSRRLTGHEVVITSCIDGSHMKKSYHYIGKAFDIRTRIYTKTQVEELMDEIISVLGDAYDVLYETDHIHIEYDPD